MTFYLFVVIRISNDNEGFKSVSSEVKYLGKAVFGSKTARDLQNAMTGTARSPN